MPYNRRTFIGKTAMLAGISGFQLTVVAAEIFSQTQGNRLVLLGTQGGPFIRSYRQTPSASAIVYNNNIIVIDSGYGVTFKLLEAGIKLNAISHIFITHHHSDHNLELGPLLYNAWIAGLNNTVQVYGPAGVSSLLKYYWDSNRIDIDMRIKDEGRPDIRALVVATEFGEGTIVSNGIFSAAAIKNIHPPFSESYALKFVLGDTKLVFSGDTTYCPALIPFSIGADYLIHEVMHGPAVEEMVKRRPGNAVKLKASILSHHTLAEDVGKIATGARVKNLVLNHLIPPDDASLTEQAWKEAVGKTFAGNIIVGKDLLQLTL